jgi:putative aldouronate transport system permease protein
MKGSKHGSRIVHYNTTLGTAFDVFNVVFLTAYSVLALLPFLYIVAGSFASTYEFRTRPFFLFPEHFNVQSYIYVLSSSRLLKAVFISVYRTCLGTLVNMFFTLTLAYPLSRRYLKGRKLILNLILFSMFFSGGMIPTYIVVNALGLIDSIWSLVLPGAISAWSLIIVKNFFQELPAGLEEAARIDGATDLQILRRVVLPLSMPVIATFSLFYAVGHWNAFFDALIYLRSADKWPIQVMLRQMITVAMQGIFGDAQSVDANIGSVPEDGVKMAVIVVSTVPILMVYPLLQKHFTKGVLVGAIKG